MNPNSRIDFSSEEVSTAGFPAIHHRDNGDARTVRSGADGASFTTWAQFSQRMRLER
jgi:hypothetical protein